MIALKIILAHLIGDYIIQSDWMAQEKTKRWLPAIVHGLTYTIGYVFITQSWLALLVIAGTHIIIDHYRLAKHLAWFKNQLVPKKYRYTWESSKDTGGYSSSTPQYLWFFLMVVADNTIHLVINTIAVFLL